MGARCAKKQQQQQDPPVIQKGWKVSVDEIVITKYLNSHPIFLNNFVGNHITNKRLKNWHDSKIFGKDEGLHGRQDVDDVKLFYHYNALLCILPFPLKADKEHIPFVIERSQYFHENPPLNLDKILYDQTTATSNDIPALVQYMYEDLFGINVSIKTELARFFLEVKTGYLDNSYHNAFHALSHVQSIYVLLKRTPDVFHDYEKKALMIAAFCHDLGHPGIREKPLIDILKNIKYQIPVLENHHTESCFLLLLDKENNIFKNMTNDKFVKVLQNIKMCILATYPPNYRIHQDRVEELMSKGYDFSQVEFRDAVQCLLMMTSDFNSMWKCWVNHLKETVNLYDEFKYEDKLLYALNKTFISDMPLSKTNQCINQIFFMTNIVWPIFEQLTKVFPCIQEIMEYTDRNLQKWKSMEQDENKDVCKL